MVPAGRLSKLSRESSCQMQAPKLALAHVPNSPAQPKEREVSLNGCFVRTYMWLFLFDGSSDVKQEQFIFEAVLGMLSKVVEMCALTDA